MLRFITVFALCASMSAAAAADTAPTPDPAMNKDHAMKSGAMKHDAMKGGAMKHDAMKGGAMKHDAMKGGAMKHDAMKDGAMKPAPKPTP